MSIAAQLSQLLTIPNNAMRVYGNDTSSSKGERSTDGADFKLVYEDEARKINPLFDVKMQRNELIQSSIQENNWNDYNAFEAKQHPAWYEETAEGFVPNKIYYGNLLETKVDALKEAQAEGDTASVKNWQHGIEETAAKFNQAPGVTPYVVGLNHNEQVAEKYGVQTADGEFFDSAYNNEMAMEHGVFERNKWYDNAIFQEDPTLQKHVETLVADRFETSAGGKTVQQEAENRIASEAAPLVKAGETESPAPLEQITDRTALDFENEMLEYLGNRKNDVTNVAQALEKYRLA